LKEQFIKRQYQFLTYATNTGTHTLKKKLLMDIRVQIDPNTRQWES
jgi:hypothetical protein